MLYTCISQETVLITGGTGFIGSHTAVELMKLGYEVVLVDNLSNSKRSVVNAIEQITKHRLRFFNIDCRNQSELESIFQSTKIDAIVHMAGYKSVSESLINPLTYYENNLYTTLNILNEMKKHRIKHLIFSSSATVYGSQVQPACVEEMPTGIGLTNPYGRTKYMIEQILEDYVSNEKDVSVTLLRYFNPIGADRSGLLGEDPQTTPTNLMPVILKVAKGEIPFLHVFGNNYSTPDGSCIRDYIHVSDLARGHVAALRHKKLGLSIYNLGTGHGTSVLEMIYRFGNLSHVKLPFKIVGRRDGDVPCVYANPSKATKELHWKTQNTIDDAIQDNLHYLSLRASAGKRYFDTFQKTILIALCAMCFVLVDWYRATKFNYYGT